MTDLYLYVNNEDSTGAWSTAGSAPYLSTQNQPTDYIYSTGRNNDSGVYSFPASGHSTETINSVTLYIYAYGVSTSDFEAILSSSATGLGPPAGSWQWVSIDVSSILTTWAQIDAATVYFDRPNTTNDAGVDCCYLLVDYQGTTPANDSQNAYMSGSVNDSDTQPAYLQGSIDASDSQPAYLGGGAGSSDSQEVYTSGIDTASDNQSVYLEGSADSSDVQAAYIVGSSDNSSSQSAYLAGGASASDSQNTYTEGFSAGTDPSVSWLWIMVPDGTLVDSQPAYLVGSIQSSDSQSSYTVGSSDESSSQSAFTSGKDTASSSSPAYSIGELGASSSQSAYSSGVVSVSASQIAFVSGVETAGDSQPAYMVGGIASSQNAYLEGYGNTSDIPAYTAGLDTDSDSQPAYTYGIVLSSQPAYTEGWAPSASSSQDAYTEGYELTASDSQPAYMDATLHGTIDVQISADIDDCYQWFSYTGQYWTRYTTLTYVQTNGQINSPYLAAWRFLGIDIPDQSTYSVTITKAYMTLYVYTPSYDDPHVRFYAQDNIAPTAPETGPMLDGRPMTDAYATWEEHSVYNKLGGWPNIWIPTPDISAPIQEVIDRPGWTPGFNICIMGYQLEDNADFRSADYAYSDHTYGAKLHIEFVVGENNTQPAYLAGSNDTSSSQSAYMDCAAVDSQPAYTAGTDTDADSQPAWTAGGIVSSDNTPAYTQGTGNISWQNAHTHGVDTTSDTQPAHITGGLGSSQSAMVMADTLGPAQPAYIEGDSGVHSESQSGYTSGTDTDNDAQSAYMSGVVLATSSQSAFCNSGQLSTTSKQSAYISADIKATQGAYLEGESTVNPYIVVSTTTRSTSLKFRVLTEGIPDTMYEAGRIIHKTIPGGIDITSGELRKKWSPTLKVFYTESEAGYGTVTELEDLYKVNGPILWQDHYGQEHTVRIVGDFQKSIVGLVVEGAGSAFIVRIDILEELNP